MPEFVPTRDPVIDDAGGLSPATTYVGLDDTQAAFTAGRVIFTNAAGDALEDSADLFFSSAGDGLLRLGSTTGGNLSANTGVFTFAGIGNTNNEVLILDLESSSNRHKINSTSGANWLDLLAYDTIAIKNRVVHSGDSDTYIDWHVDELEFVAGGVEFINMTEAATDVLSLGTAGTINVDIASNGSSLSFFGAGGSLLITGYTTFANLSTDRTCDANATSVAELADILGTLIVDLKSYGIISA